MVTLLPSLDTFIQDYHFITKIKEFNEQKQSNEPNTFKQMSISCMPSVGIH